MVAAEGLLVNILASAERGLGDPRQGTARLARRALPTLEG
jgi:hypothetical protein